MTDPETVADVAVNIRRAVEYIEKQYPGAKTLDAAPILRSMKRWASQIERAMAASAVPLAWIRLFDDGTEEGPIPAALMTDAMRKCGGWVPLYAHAQPAVPVESLGRDAPICCDGVCNGNCDGDPVLQAAAAKWRRENSSAPPPASVQDVLTADDVQWIVNDNAELGVMIRGQAFFLYKGDSLVYDDAKHDDGTPMYYRTVGKREFGECAYPINHSDYSKQGTVSLDDSDRWQLLPPTTPEESP